MRELTPSRNPVSVRPATAVCLASAGLAVLCVHGACVTENVARTPSAPPVSGMVVIPYPKAKAGALEGSAALRDYYTNVLGQMQEALADGSVDVLHGLLQQHDRTGAPRWAREQMTNFRQAGQSLEFANFLRQRVQIKFAQAEAPALGAPLRLRITMPPWPDHVVRIGAQNVGGPAPMRVRFAIVDRDATGARTEHRDSEMLRVAEPIVLRSGWPFAMEFNFEFPAGAAVRRDVEIGLDLLPGYLQIDDRKLPVMASQIATRTVRLWPQGTEPIAAEPLKHLLAAVQRVDRGENAWFDHVYVAANFVGAEQRDAAIGGLMPWIRFGTPRQLAVADAAIGVLVGEEFVRDREEWLAWWQRRAVR